MPIFRLIQSPCLDNDSLCVGTFPVDTIRQSYTQRRIILQIIPELYNLIPKVSQVFNTIRMFDIGQIH